MLLRVLKYSRGTFPRPRARTSGDLTTHLCALRGTVPQQPFTSRGTEGSVPEDTQGHIFLVLVLERKPGLCHSSVVGFGLQFLKVSVLIMRYGSGENHL